MRVTLAYEGESTALSPREVSGVERLGQARRLVIDAFADQAIPLGKLLGKAAVLTLQTELGERSIHGMIAEATAVASGMGQPQRRYRVVLSSTLSRLELRRRCRVFQRQTAAQIIQQIADEGGLGAVAQETDELPERRYVTQYHETDAQFVRRLCEEDGIWLREEPGDEASRYVLADNPMGAPRDKPVVLADEAGLLADERRAWGVRAERERATGRVLTRDYAFATPAVSIEGKHEMGLPHERAATVFRVADRCPDGAVAARRSQLHLESLRAQAQRIRFETTALSLYPGVVVSLGGGGAYSGLAQVGGDVFVVEVQHRWEHGEAYRASVTAVPSEVAYRLPRTTRRPQIAGVQYAIVTGPAGEEIFVDDAGCVRVRFLWDRYGPTDDGSSLPVRVLQPNLEGSMLVPRVGWEVWVAFEDGDPDRPYVLGRAFNGKHPPPVSLPENKTMTSLSTSASPGAACQNFVRYEDGAGRQGFNWNAGFNMERTIGANMKTQTGGDDRTVIEGSQSLSVGGNQTESVTIGRVLDVKAQSIGVGGLQTLSTPQAMTEQIDGTQSLMVGGALIEQVGSPGDVAADLGVALLGAVGGLAGNAGIQFAAGLVGPLYNIGKALVKGDEDAAWGEVGKLITSKLPGGDVAGLVTDVTDASAKANDEAGLMDQKLKKEKRKEGDTKNSNVGGAAASSAAAPKASGSGDRIHSVAGTGLEMVGGALMIVTPGASKCTTLGAAVCLASGPHVTVAAKVSSMTAGVSLHTTGLYKITTSEMVRDVTAYSCAIGPWNSSASGAWIMRAYSSATINCGALRASGKVTLKCGGSKVVIDGSGMTIESPSIVIEQPNNASELVRS
jgi:type VI secretion system secreted protein VgrG